MARPGRLTFYIDLTWPRIPSSDALFRPNIPSTIEIFDIETLLNGCALKKYIK